MNGGFFYLKNMQGKDSIFAIQDKNFNFWNFSNGIAFKSAQPYFLKFAPSGWEDIQIDNIRNKRYWGIDRSVTIPLSYVEDGAAILKYIFYNLGIEEPGFLAVANQKLDYDTIPQGTIIGINPFVQGINTGTISGTPGSTVYVQLKVSGILDNSVFGNIGDITVNVSPAFAPIYTIVIPDAGYVTYSLFLNFVGGISGVVPAQLILVNKDGTISPSYGYWYKKIFRSQIDLSTFVHQGSKVTCTCLEDGLPKYLKANEGTVFEFPLNVPEAIWVKMDGINMHESTNYKVLNSFDVAYSVYGNEIFLPISFINNEGDSVGILEESQTIQSVASLSWSDKMVLPNFLLQNVGTKPVVVNVSGTIEFVCNKMVSSPGFAFKARFLTSTMPIDPPHQDRYKIIDTPSMVAGQTYSVPFSIDIPLDLNEKLFFEGIFYGGPGSEVVINFTDNNNYKIKFITKYDPTYIRAFRPQYLFEQLMNSVTEKNLKAAISAYFEKYKNFVFTSGNGIRGLYNVSTTTNGITTVNNATVKIPFTDFFKFWDSFDSVGIQINADNTILFDSKQNLIDKNNIIDLPEVAADSLKVSVDKSFMFNEVHFGYPAISSDVGVLNANDEINSQMIFSLGTTITPAVLDKVSPVKAMPYEIEKIRITQINLTTTGFPTDNDNYVLAIEDELQPAVGDIPAHYNLDRSLNASATGLMEPATIFNLPLSPKRMLLRNGAFMRSCLYRSDTKVLKFISADKNNKLVCDGIVEKADVTVGSLDAPFFFPILFDFSIDAPDDLEDLLDVNPLQLFRFPFRGTSYVGILNKVSVAPSSRAAQAYQLLSVPENNLQTLIDYYGE